jgi:4-amino-4-deoxy-L-arabinose transferase-like glycosyltransferase
MLIDDPHRDVPARWEWACVLALLAVWLAINLLTANVSPIVHTDEALFADPAWHLATGRGLTSTFWAQPPGTFYATNVPLYFVILAQWIKLFGLSPLAVRSLDMLLVVFASAAVWLAVRRGGLVRSPRAAFAMLLVLLASTEVSTIARNARYDALCALTCSVAFLGAMSPSKYARATIALTAGIIAPLAGLQMILYLGALGILLLLFWPRRLVRVVLWLWLGMAIGVGLLALILHMNHALMPFWSVLRRVKPFQPPPSAPRQIMIFVTAHPTLIIGGVVLLALALAARRRGELHWRSPEIFGLVSAIGIPSALAMFYHFRGEYGWMISAPILIAIVMSMLRLRTENRRSVAFAFACAGLLAIALIGYPLMMAGGIVRAAGRDYTRVTRFVQQNLQPTDRVAIDPPAYYPARTLAAECIGQYQIPALSADEKAAINVLIIDPGNKPAFAQSLGGTWREVADMPAIQPARLAWVRYPGDKAVYELATYRREPK